LIVGINDYENPANQLNGCVNDAYDVAETLKILHFPPSHIKLVLDRKATTKGILAGLSWLTKDAVAGDVLVFAYSGHGSYVVDLNDDELDKKDEIICPCDIDWDTETYITDDKLFEYFTKKCPPGVRCDVFLDSCFSGSATRSLNNNRDEQRKQRFLPPPADHQFRANSMIPLFTDIKPFGRAITTLETGKKDIEQVTQNNCLWSGCQEWQTSAEDYMDGKVRGVLTYYLMKIFRASNGDITRGQAYSILRSTIAKDGWDQVPNLEVPNAEAINIFPIRKISEVDRESEVKKNVSEGTTQ
jgi:hypothetical protein